MKKKELDIIDLLEPGTITVKEYEHQNIPFQNETWLESGDLTLAELSRILPHQFPFVYALLHEHPNLLPSGNRSPGRIEELILRDIMTNLKCRTQRDHRLELQVLKLWESCGGNISNELRKDFNYGRSK